MATGRRSSIEGQIRTLWTAGAVGEADDQTLLPGTRVVRTTRRKKPSGFSSSATARWSFAFAGR
jgi:hypothetical protein